MGANNIRLACRDCDREDQDLISAAGLRRAKGDGWTSIEKVRTYRQSLRESKSSPLTEWWTHLGYCPECAAILDGAYSAVTTLGAAP